MKSYQAARCPHDGVWHLNNHIAIDFHISVSGQTIVAVVKIPLRISNPSIECILRKKDRLRKRLIEFEMQ